jgi:hypothetical protein
MREAVYNSAILDATPDAIPNVIADMAKRAVRLTSCFLSVPFLLTMFSLSTAALAADWSAPETQLARKIAAVTGPGAVVLTVQNRSSLTRRESEIIQNGLRVALEGVGLRFVPDDQAAASVTVSLSENLTAYVWVAEIRQGTNESAVVMVQLPRPEGSTGPRDSVPLTLRKIPMWVQAEPILDVAVLEENAPPTHIAVLDAAKVSLYRMQGGKWQLEQALEILHAKPWPRDLRGRLILARDHLLDVYLPGVICHSSANPPLALNCRESDDPWPLAAAGGATVFPSAGASDLAAPAASTATPQTKAFFAPTRNFFTGVLAPGVGKFTTVPKFYSAAWLPRDRYTLWLFSATDGQVHMVDGVSDQVAKLGWGSDFTSVRTMCGAGWQVLAPGSGDVAEDTLRAYEIPDRDPVAVSAATDLPGTITTLWTEPRGDTAITVARNRETGNYEAFRLALACQ